MVISLDSVTVVVNQILPEPHAGLLLGILFGVKANMDPVLKQSLIDSGTMHIVALSGTNITIIISLVAAVLLRFINRRYASIFAIVFIIGFLLFVGPSPSVIRAAIMGCIALIGLVLGRPVWALWSLFISALVMVVFMPGIVGDLSFQLSVAATLGLILYGREKTGSAALSASPSVISVPKVPVSGWDKVKNIITDDLRVTLSAQVFTIPLTIMHFQRISLISPLSNLLIGWVLAPLTVWGFVTVVSGLVFLPLGRIFGLIIWIPLQYILQVIAITAQVPFSSISW